MDEANQNMDTDVTDERTDGDGGAEGGQGKVWYLPLVSLGLHKKCVWARLAFDNPECCADKRRHRNTPKYDL